MPELPEVENVRRAAAPLLCGRRLLRLELAREDLRWPLPVAALQDLVGRRCRAIDRRSKYLLLHFDGAATPVAIVHLGMSGRFLVDALRRGSPRPEWRRHEHWRMDFGDRVVRYVDPRRFGMLDVAAASDLGSHRLLQDLGEEPLATRFGADFLHACSRGKKASIKSMLMDARLVVGIGNIYASEACWRARVRPRRAAGTLSRSECAALATAVRTVLAAAIAAGGTSFRDYVGVDEQAGYFARELRVYERSGRPCRRCGGEVRRTVDAGRSTYWCAGCQR